MSIGLLFLVMFMGLLVPLAIWLVVFAMIAVQRAVSSRGERAATGAVGGDRWMIWYFVGLAVLFVVALVYYRRIGFFPFDGSVSWIERRAEVLDVIAFAIAAVVYPFLIRAVIWRSGLRGRALRRTGSGSAPPG